MSFNLGNAVKSIWRAGLKTDQPIEDLEKARFYIEREILRLQKLPQEQINADEKDHVLQDQYRETTVSEDRARDSVVPSPRGRNTPERHAPMPDLPKARCSCGAAEACSKPRPLTHDPVVAHETPWGLY